MCEWGLDAPWTWGDSMAQVIAPVATSHATPVLTPDAMYARESVTVSQSWRMSEDHTGNWGSTQRIIAESAAIPAEYSGRP